MKKIEAIIRPEKFKVVRDALAQHGISGLTVSEVAGCGNQKSKKGFFRGTTFEIQLVPKIKIEMVVSADQVDSIVDIFLKEASTDTIGDGKIFISPVEEVIRIRSGERGQEAI
ncbi:P-II family nitrogen regulator [Mangrovibacillus cuniculi]|uniref:P-II family nitrogen regulator n=1 Tax=Mangrovibacillus cuniculi TaxID=2593652 RepID=A0A7S8HF11_9BACI|nr:P-II family nitrogen regulator [Mangrovibacillus cuniculi]QPC46041.1 P-II family nitrogen regulator [Mangrovibacillus cuniculi]